LHAFCPCSADFNPLEQQSLVHNPALPPARQGKKLQSQNQPTAIDNFIQWPILLNDLLNCFNTENRLKSAKYGSQEVPARTSEGF
jgi:hypothetical protein